MSASDTLRHLSTISIQSIYIVKPIKTLFYILILLLWLVPNGSVCGLRRERSNFTSITISWQPVDCFLQNGAIIQYMIHYNETVTMRQISSDTVEANILQFTTSTLFPGTMYTFQVAAVNNNGTGPYTSLQVSTSNPTG